jgi:hypothetical protein
MCSFLNVTGGHAASEAGENADLRQSEQVMRA